jgi:hypothetical protein
MQSSCSILVYLLNGIASSTSSGSTAEKSSDWSAVPCSGGDETLLTVERHQQHLFVPFVFCFTYTTILREELVYNTAV